MATSSRKTTFLCTLRHALDCASVKACELLMFDKFTRWLRDATKTCQVKILKQPPDQLEFNKLYHWKDDDFICCLKKFRRNPLRNVVTASNAQPIYLTDFYL